MTSIEIVKKFLEPALSLKKVTVKAIFVGLIIGIYKLLSVILVQYISNFIAVKEYNKIVYLGLALLGLLLFISTLFQKIYHRRRGSQIYKYGKYINQKYLTKIMLIDNTEFEKIGTGKIISSLSSGVDLRSDSLSSISYFLPNFLITLAYGIYLSYTGGPIITAIFLGMMFFIGLSIYLLNGRGLSHRKDLATSKVQISKNTVKLLMSKFEVIVSNKLQSEVQKMNSYYDEAILLNTKLSYFTFFIHESIRVFINLFIVSICIYVGYYGYSVGMNISTIVGLIMILGYIDNTAQDLAVIYKQTTKNLSSIQKLRELEDNKSIQLGESGSDFKYKAGNISIKNTSFSYTDNRKIFDNFSIDISGSQKIAFVGPSGGGKSTLIKLVAGYIRPDEGNIYIDDQNLMEVSLKSYYSHIGYLTQEPSVFDGTIRENLLYGVGSESDSNNLQIDNVIKLSRCEWIYNLSDGLDTEIGEKGIRLSGGQRQRLAIAKIMLKNPNIILLDEPTSSLDSENEELVTQALNNLFAGKTVIVIAHRLQTVKHADQIIYINNGQVIESGTHEELLNLGGEYAKMVELQSGF